MVTPLEMSILEELAQMLSHVKDFQVAWMNELPTEVRCQFVDFASMVIEQH